MPAALAGTRRPGSLTSFMSHQRARLAAAGLLAAVFLVACTSSAGDDRVAPYSEPSRDAVTSTSTTVPPPPPPPPVYRPGAEGPEVAGIQQRLADLKYDVGTVDGRYGDATAQAVMAFQKVHGLGRDGHAGPETMGALDTAAGDPAPLVPDGEPDRVEVDLGRQVLFLYQGGTLTKIVAVSTGNGEHYCSEGRCRNAVTPTGAFTVGRRYAGWQRSPLGRLYNPLYFNGGIALHGSLSVPAGPASHGCVRVAMHTAEWLPMAVPTGMRVYVVDGPTDAAALGAAPSPPPPEPAPPPETPPPPPPAPPAPPPPPAPMPPPPPAPAAPEAPTS